MGMDLVVAGAGACAIAELLDALARAGIAASVIMVDGALHAPGAPVSGSWRDVRLKTAAGTVSLKRRSDGIAVVVFGNADAALVDTQRAIARIIEARAEA